MTFQQLDIIAPILAAIDQEGYETPSPIQVEALPIILGGHDLLASAQTGTGKTAAFAIPIIQLIANAKEAGDDGRRIRALVLSPTRELAEQIKESFKTYAGKLNIKTGAIYGGASQKGQEMMLKRGIDVLVATPGRLIDLMRQKIVSLSDVRYFVLDEADTLLDMGFIKDVKHIKGFITKERQTLMFSATVSPEVAKLAGELLINPKTLIMAPPEMMIDKINHSLFYVDKKQKFELLLDLLTDAKLESVLVFTRTKHGANKLVKDLVEYGVKVDAIHGNKSQSARQTALNDFKSKRIRVLIATDIASRGIDIDDLTHVINFDLPESPESYVHRIGRTGRRGLSGEAYTFCSPGERALLKAVEKHTGLKLTVLDLKPVSEDSKFKRVVVAENQEKSSLSTTSRPERPSNRRYVGNDDAKQYKAKVEKRRDGKRDFVDNAPANFGKRRSETSDKKKLFQNISEEAFNDADKPRSRAKSRPVSEGASNETRAPRTYVRKEGEGRSYDRPRSSEGGERRPYTKSAGYQGSRPRTSEGSEARSYAKPRSYEGRSTEGGERRPYTKSTGYQGSRPRTSEGGEARSYSKPRSYEGRSTEGGERRPYTKSTGYQGSRPRTSEGGEARSYSKPRSYEGRSTEGGEKRPYTKSVGYQGSRPRTSEGGEARSYSKPRSYEGRSTEGGEKRSYGRPAAFNTRSTSKSKTPFVEFGDGRPAPKKTGYQGKRNDFGASKASEGGEKRSYNKGGYKGSSSTSRPRTNTAKSYTGKPRARKSD